MNFKRGDAVNTPHGPGRVAYVRFGPLHDVVALSVVLDAKKLDLGYSGSMYLAKEVEANGE